MYHYAAYLVDRQCLIYCGIIYHGSYVDVYLAVNDVFCEACFTLLEGDDVGEVVVAQEVAVELSVVLRRAEDVVYLACGVPLAAYNLLYPATCCEASGQRVVASLGVEMYHTLLFEALHHRHCLVGVGVVYHKEHISALDALVVDGDAYCAYLLVLLYGATLCHTY